ncbi:short-chain dehydrogenase/reductase SDR [Xylariaceae sp. FL0255]|nr:short-chain dehydrogenase/reductase SDR [Xylariaceae sp. FL0255]
MSRSLVRDLLRGKTACDTGGTTGIGRAIPLEYLRQGANVAVSHLDLAHNEQLKQSLIKEAATIKSQSTQNVPAGELMEVAGDITNPKTNEGLISVAVKIWGKVDVLVSNAGIIKPAEFLLKEQFDDTMRVNCTHGGGMQIHYPPNKSPISSLVQSMAISLATHRIRVNALLPGTVHTQLSEELCFFGCEQLSSWMTGSQILVDGSMYTPLQWLLSK